MSRTKIALWLIGLAFALAAPRAEAIPPVFLQADADPFTICADQAACDLNPAAGAITFTGPLGLGFVVNVVTGLTTPSLAGTQMDLNSIHVQTSSGGNLTIRFSETGFTDLLGFVTTLGGTMSTPAGSTVTASSYFDDTAPTGLFSLETPIATIGPFGPGAFAGSVTSGLASSAPYSLTQVVDIHVTGQGVVSLDFTVTASERVIPEPASAALFAAGALVVGAAVRRRA